MALAACLTAGTALWFTRGVLDAFGDERTITRVALLPSGAEFLGLIMLALMLAVGAGAAMARSIGGDSPTESGTPRSEPHDAWPRAVFQISFPLLTLAVIALPYLPWLPDRWLALRSLAGPMVRVIWFVVVAQVAWVAWSVWPWVQRRVAGLRLPLPHVSAPAVIFLLGIAVFGGAATRMARSNLFPGGDEPHYLIMMQSLWRDHDLRIENNHAREDYTEYFNAPLSPDYRTRGIDGQIYSIHPVGLPVLAAPVFGVAGYRGVVWLLVVMAALTATLMWRWAQVSTGSDEAATVAWVAVCTGTPFLFNSFAVYPEIPAALCVMVAIGWRPDAVRRDPRSREYFVRAMAISVLPWLSTKYAPMAAALVAVLAWRALRHRRALVALVLPFLVSLGLWLAFFYWIWGSPSPTAPYGSSTQTSLATLSVGGPGLLFDQEYGVLIFAPALAIGIVGLARMCWDRDRMLFARAAEVALVAAGLLVAVGSFDLWWGGSAPPGRPLVSGLPLLGLPLAWQYRRSSTKPAVRAAYQLLVLVGLAVSGTILLAENGLLLAQSRDGSSVLLQFLSPLWHLSTLMPSFFHEDLSRAPGLAVLWTVVALVVGWICGRSRAQAPGPATLTATACVGGAVLFVSAVVPMVSRDTAHAGWNPATRSRVPLLDTFDARARPLALVYNPLNVVRPEEIPPLMTLMASPEARFGRQPLRVFLNARFALPAGTYQIEIGGVPAGGDTQEPLVGTVGLQVGRIGLPLYEWTASVGPAEPWRASFTLPVDAEFVGFRTSPSLDSATRLWLRPVRVVDRARRIPGPPVLSSAAYPTASVFFRSDDVWIEPFGFWVRGRSTAIVSVVRSGDSADRLTLKLHSGARPNTVTIEALYWRERVDLTPNVSREVQVPTRGRPLIIPLRITTADGFVPAEILPDDNDRRLLGCWVEIVG
jgi:hypothetical protein